MTFKNQNSASGAEEEKYEGNFQARKKNDNMSC
jgi:hypothetical protein